MENICGWGFPIEKETRQRNRRRRKGQFTLFGNGRWGHSRSPKLHTGEESSAFGRAISMRITAHLIVLSHLGRFPRVGVMVNQPGTFANKRLIYLPNVVADFNWRRLPRFAENPLTNRPTLAFYLYRQWLRFTSNQIILLLN